MKISLREKRYRNELRMDHTKKVEIELRTQMKMFENRFFLCGPQFSRVLAKCLQAVGIAIPHQS